MLSTENLIQIEPSYKKVLRISTILWALFVCGFGLFFTWVNEWGMISVGVLTVVVLFFLFMFLFYPRKVYENTFYGLVDEVFYVQKGLWFKKRSAVAQNRIQHTDVDQGPLMRKFGLASLVLHTAGVREGDIRISGLTHDDATYMRNHLLKLNKQAVRAKSQNKRDDNTSTDFVKLNPNTNLSPNETAYATSVLTLNSDISQSVMGEEE